MPTPDVKKIGKYEILAELGQGGFGRVYRAFDPTVGRPVALKILTSEGNRDLLTRFKNEATSAGNLRHRNIVTIHDYGEFNGRPYLVMELLEGEDLTETISSGRPLTLLEKMNIMDQVADGLHCAHSNGVVHRDVKPANIRLLPDGTVKILDFGIARVRRDEKATRLTQQGDLIGTILYMSPEQFGGADADALCDIFAYGVIYFEFLTGKHPFGSKDPRSVMFKITMEDPPSLRTLLPDCPEALEQLLHRALHKDRDLRYQNLGDLRLDAEPLIFELRQDRAKNLLGDAQLLVDSNPRDAASIVNEALNFDPGNREARQLRELINRRLQAEALQPKIDAMLRTAAEQLAARSASQAVQTLESALKLDASDARVRESLENARRQLEIFNEAARLAAAASTHASRAEWLLALKQAEGAAQLDPPNETAARVLLAVQKYERELLSRIERQISEDDLTSAISGLEDLAALRPDSREIQERLTATIARRELRERVRVAVERTGELIGQARFDEALLALLESPIQDTPEIQQLRQTAEDGQLAVKRAQAVTKVAYTAESFLSAGRIDEALRELADGLAAYPNEPRLVDLHGAASLAQAARERELQIQSVASDCKRLCGEHRFDQAFERLQEGLRRFPAEPALAELPEFISEQKARHDREEALRQAVEAGQGLLTRDQPEQAVALLNAAAVKYPEEKLLARLLAKAREELQLQQRRNGVNAAKSEANNRLKASDFSAALAILDDGLKSWPGDPELLELRQEANAAKARSDRQRAIGEVKQRCEALLQSKRFADAVDAARAGLHTFSNEPALVELQRRGESELENEQRKEEVRAVLSRASALEKTFDFTGALAELETGLARFPKEKELSDRRRSIEIAQSEYARRLSREAALKQVSELAERAETNLTDDELAGMLEETKAIAKANSKDQELYRSAVNIGQQLLDLQQARTKVSGDDFEAARVIIERYLKIAPRHAGFLDVQGRIATREREIAASYAAQVQSAVSRADTLEDRLRVLEEALKRYPQEPSYREALDQATVAGSMAQSADSLEKEGKFADALDQWSRIRSTYPSFPGLDSHIERLTALRDRSRSDARERWTGQIRKTLADCEYVQALDLVRKAEAEFPGEFKPFEVQAKQGVDARTAAQRLISDALKLSGKGQPADAQRKLREAKERAPDDRVIASQMGGAHEDCARKVVKSDWQAATALLDQALNLDPSFQISPDLRAEIEKRKRAETVEQALRNCQGLQRAGNFQSALAALVKVLEIYPDEPQLLEQKNPIELHLREAARLRQRKRDLEELNRLNAETRAAKDPQELPKILARVRPLLGEYEKDPEFASLGQAIVQQLEGLQAGYRLLEENKWDDSEGVATKMLALFPDHPAFLLLKRNIDDARERAAAAYRDLVNRKLAEKIDLAQREDILLEATQAYPSDEAFLRDLDAVREQRRLAAEVATSAREAERSGDYEDALRHWNQLRTIDPQFPKLDQEIQRVTAQIEVARQNAVRAVISQAGEAIDRGNLQEAGELLAGLETKLGKSVGDATAPLRARLEAVRAATRLAEEGRRQIASQDYRGGSAKFAQAARTIPNESRTLHLFLAELLDLAGGVMVQDPTGATYILDAAAQIDASSPALSALRLKLTEIQREEDLVTILAEIQQQQDAGELRSAEKSIQTALAAYPAETRLLDRLAAVRSAIDERARAQRRDEVLTELAAIAKEIKTANLKRLRKAAKQVDAVLGRDGSDPEIQERAASVNAGLLSRISALESTPQEAPDTRVIEDTPAVIPPPASSNSKRNFMFASVGAAALVVAAFIAFSRLTPGKDVPVSITSDVGSASITVGNQNCVTPNCDLKLLPGNYTLNAKRDGFKAISQTVTVPLQRGELKIPLSFEALPEILQVNTNFENGSVVLDGHPAGTLRDGQFSLSGVAAGHHQLRVTGGGAEFQTEWESKSGSSPELLGSITAKDAEATVVANAGANGAIACNCDVQNLMVDGSPAQSKPAGTTGASLKNLTEGTRKVTMTGRSLIVDIRPNPTLNVFLATDRNAGTLIVETGEDNVKIYLNNRAYGRTTEHGVIRIPVDVGKYSIRAEKAGFQVPAAQTVEVHKGEERRLASLLKPIPPVLEIAGGLPGAQVKVDGRAAGDIAQNGSFRIEVAPGDHVIDLTKDDYSPVRLNAHSNAGETSRFDRAQVAMARVNRTPSAPPPPPDPKQIEAQDWERIRNSNAVEVIDDFISKHPDGAHLDEARAKAAQLRQQAQNTLARQAEQTLWDATDKTKKSALQDFLSRFGNGVHSQEARGLISGIDKQESDALASQRAKEQDQANRSAADQESINRTIGAYESAYNQKDLRTLQTIWNGMPKNISDATGSQFREARSLAFQMRPSGPAAVNGDTATINCTRSLSLTTKDNTRLPPANDRVRVSLDRSASGWVIRSITPY